MSMCTCVPIHMWACMCACCTQRLHLSSMCTQPRCMDVGAHTCSCTPTHPTKHTHPSGPVHEPACCGTLQHYFVVARYCWRGYSSRKAIFPPLIEKYSLIDLIIKWTSPNDVSMGTEKQIFAVELNLPLIARTGIKVIRNLALDIVNLDFQCSFLLSFDLFSKGPACHTGSRSWHFLSVTARRFKAHSSRYLHLAFIYSLLLCILLLSLIPRCRGALKHTARKTPLFQIKNNSAENKPEQTCFPRQKPFSII